MGSKVNNNQAAAWNPFYTIKKYGSGDDSAYLYGLFGNECDLGVGGNDSVTATTVAGYNKVVASGSGRKTINIISGVGYNSIKYNNFGGERSDFVVCTANNGAGGNSIELEGATRATIQASNWLGANAMNTPESASRSSAPDGLDQSG